MRKSTHFTAEQEQWLVRSYHKVTSYDELTDEFNRVFGSNRKKSSIREKCNKSLHLVGMPNQTRYGNKAKEQLPIGSIRRSQNATYIKVLEVPPGICFSGYAEPYWLPLQKKIYQDAYGDIGPEQMICFLDHNSENFKLDNLYCIDRKISVIMSKNRWWSDNPEFTLTAIKWCELHYAIKDVKGEKEMNNHIKKIIDILDDSPFKWTFVSDPKSGDITIRISNATNASYNRNIGHRVSYRNNSAYNLYKTFVFETFNDAENTLNNLKQIIEMYDVVFVSDLYDIIGESASYIDTKYGWISMDTAKIVDCGIGYELKLPRALPIE